MGSKRLKKNFFSCFSIISETKIMSEITYDEFLDKLDPDELTDGNFQTPSSTPPKTDIVDLMQSNLSYSMNISLSPCIVSSTCLGLSCTAINPLFLQNSPRGFGNDSVEDFVQPKKKSLSLGPRQVYLSVLILKQTYSKFKVENNSQSMCVKNLTGKM